LFDFIDVQSVNPLTSNDYQFIQRTVRPVLGATYSERFHDWLESSTVVDTGIYTWEIRFSQVPVFSNLSAAVFPLNPRGVRELCAIRVSQWGYHV
jgi:hypothetical protein